MTTSSGSSTWCFDFYFSLTITHRRESRGISASWWLSQGSLASRRAPTYRKISVAPFPMPIPLCRGLHFYPAFQVKLMPLDMFRCFNLAFSVLFAGFLVARHSVNACLFLTFIAGLLLNCNWEVIDNKPQWNLAYIQFYRLKTESEDLSCILA